MRYKLLILLSIFLMALTFPGASQKVFAGGKTQKLTSAESYIAVPPLNVSILRRYKMRGMLQIMVGLDVEDKDLRHKVEIMLPRLQDIFLRDLNEYAATGHEMGKPVDVFAVSDRLQRLTDETLGEEGAILLLSLAMVL